MTRTRGVREGSGESADAVQSGARDAQSADATSEAQITEARRAAGPRSRHGMRQRAVAGSRVWRELTSVFDRALAVDALAAVGGAFAFGWLSSDALFIGALLGGAMSRLVRIVVRGWKTRTIWQVSGGFGLWDIWRLIRASSHAAGAAGAQTGAGAVAQGVAVVATAACAAGTVTAVKPLLSNPPESRDARGGLQVGGGAVGVSIRRPGQHATLTFAGRKGDRLTAFASDVDFDGPGDVKVSVREPGDRGSLMAGWVDEANGEVAGSRTLPVTGTYTVLVEPYDGATGSVDLRLARTH